MVVLKDERSLTLFELLLVACCIFVLLGTFAVYANTVLKKGREEALRNELLNLRMSVEYYRVINGRLPAELVDLRNKKLTDNNSGGKIIPIRLPQYFRIDKKGFLRDPFFNRYAYNDKTGEVRSSTKGYERW